METLMEILKELKPFVDFEKEEHLIDEHILNSLEIMTLVSRIDDEFDVQIPLVEVVPENFQSAKAIHRMIVRVQEEE
ncbi:phosphopantetheine-binding protein [Lachnoclostridium sp. An181]|uniref:phosphopantetheine-binding protein n=1 Tax=Lachnoclostridium sp. An181 TaxID=1965575 RepID=UPI000B39DEA1|nr:phosphopantetheine-binding protein [Lachnoclostridium sp. An181]OUP49043.1 acyl carrier protein [Lachnoclostridium sp. An181]